MGLTSVLRGCTRMRLRRKAIRWVVFAILSSLVIIPVIREFIFGDPLTNFTGDENTAEWESKLDSSTKVMLMYTTFWHKPVWFGLTGKKLHDYFDNYSCEYENCLVTYDRKKIQRADALIFHARDIELYRNYRYSAEKLKELRRRVPYKQKWIFLSHENPNDDINWYKPYDGVFNWTASFTRKSDVFMPYTAFTRLRQKSKVPLWNYAKEKTGLVAWASSHCNLMRQEYALELQNYVHLTVYGKCRHFFKNRKNCKHFNKKCDEEISRYKFFLAFENEFCDDYVTEKYWERITQDSVPVVMGTHYDNEIVIPGSYIDASKFDSIKSLAGYLKYLDQNDTAYNEYFAWKQNYAIDEKYSLLCKLCKSLHSQKFRKKSTVKTSEFYDKQKTCIEPYRNQISKFKEQIEKSRSEREKTLSFLSVIFGKLENAFIRLRILLALA